MRQRSFAFGLGTMALVLVLLSLGCGSGDTAQFRIVQASPAVPTSNVVIDGTTQTDTMTYGSASSYVQISSGDAHVQLIPINTTTPAVDVHVSLGSQTNSTLVISGLAGNISTTLLNDSQTSPTLGDFSVRIMNAAPSLGPADVYIVPSGTNIASVTPSISALAFQNVSPYSSFAAGTFQIFFTLPGTKTSLFDPQSIAFSDAQNRTIVILDGPTSGFTTLTLPDLD